MGYGTGKNLPKLIQDSDGRPENATVVVAKLRVIAENGYIASSVRFCGEEVERICRKRICLTQIYFVAQVSHGRYGYSTQGESSTMVDIDESCHQLTVKDRLPPMRKPSSNSSRGSLNWNADFSISFEYLKQFVVLLDSLWTFEHWESSSSIVVDQLVRSKLPECTETYVTTQGNGPVSPSSKVCNHGCAAYRECVRVRVSPHREARLVTLPCV